MVYQGESTRIRGTFTDMDGTASNPTTHSVKLFDPAGVQSGETSTTPIDSGTTGTHYQWWNIASDAEEGTWYCEWTVVIADRTGVFKVPFKVEAVR